MNITKIDPRTGFTWKHVSVAVRPFDNIVVNDYYNKIVQTADLMSAYRQFDPRFAQPIITAELQTGEVLLNGQKTLKLLKLKGITEWLIVTIHGLTEKDFYKAYDAVSGSGHKPSKPVDVFRCQYRGGNAMHVNIVKAAEEFGFRIPLYEKDRMLNDVRRHRALESAYLAYGQTAGIRKLFRVLSKVFVCSSTTKELQIAASTSYFVTGLAKFLAETKCEVGDVVLRFRSIAIHATDVTEEASARARNMTSVRRPMQDKLTCAVASALTDAMYSDEWRTASAAYAGVDHSTD